MIHKNQPHRDDNNNISAQALEQLRPSWRKSLLAGDGDAVAQMVSAGVPVDFPIDDSSRSPLVELALIVPDSPAHEQALAETARFLINSGAALSLPDYKGLTPADYAMISPNPVLAREIVISTLRHEVNRGLVHSFRPRVETLFALTISRKDRIALQDNLSDNLYEIKDALKFANAKNDPLLLNLNPEILEFWNKLQPLNHEDMPAPSTALRQQFRRVSAMHTPEEGHEDHDTYSKDEIDDAQIQYKFLEWRHAQKFQI
jgi:hypothetical protein